MPHDIRSAKTQVGLFQTPLEGYFLNVGKYPSTEQGLEALMTRPKDLPPSVKWDGPYLAKGIPLDRWGRPYHYLSPGKHNPDKYDLWSSGRDGVSGTADDIGNW
jgi:general secretion pathway protein G